tara:strand:- start:1167 stop:1352 length:186 start_codon:yes stop_codon:yes gene_type:complete
MINIKLQNINETLKGLANEFREWNKKWDNYKGDCKQPVPCEEFILEMRNKYFTKSNTKFKK